MSGDDYVTVVGLDRVMARLDPKRWDAAARTGLLRAGQVAIEARARANVEAEHHYKGNLAQRLHTDVRGSGLNLEAHIGINSSVVPEGRPLEFGRRAGAKQPPVAAIAEWLTQHPEIVNDRSLTRRDNHGNIRYGKGGKQASIRSLASGAAYPGATVSLAFLIARKIGRRGFSFGKLEWMRKAGIDGRAQAGQIIRDALATVR